MFAFRLAHFFIHSFFYFLPSQWNWTKSGSSLCESASTTLRPTVKRLTKNLCPLLLFFLWGAQLSHWFCVWCHTYKVVLREKKEKETPLPYNTCCTAVCFEWEEVLTIKQAFYKTPSWSQPGSFQSDISIKQCLWRRPGWQYIRGDYDRH